jgi:hypothetical protein
MQYVAFCHMQLVHENRIELDNRPTCHKHANDPGKPFPGRISIPERQHVASTSGRSVDTEAGRGLTEGLCVMVSARFR